MKACGELHTEFAEPAWNIALEMILAEKPPMLPLLRIWRSPLSVVLGRSTPLEQAVDIFYCLKNAIPILRRPSGGGAVVHDTGNLNFSLFLPRSFTRFSPRRLFAELAPIPVLALRRLGLSASCVRTSDIVIAGKKVSGLAIFLARRVVLFHGTLLWRTPIRLMEKILLPPLHRGFLTHRDYVANLAEFGIRCSLECLVEALREAVQEVLDCMLVPLSLDGEFRRAASALAPAVVVPYPLFPAPPDPMTLRHRGRLIVQETL